MIIKSILDLDLYKLTMAWAVMQKYPEYEVEYEFQNRDQREFPIGFDEELQKEINTLSKLFLTKEEENYLRKNVTFLPELFIQWLKGYRYDSSEICITQTKGKDNLKISAKGYWFRTIMWETTILSIVSELYFKDVKIDLLEVINKTKKKGLHFRKKNQKVAEMGTRRRFSYDVQDAAIKALLSTGKNSIVGTSNVHFAMKYGITAIGTISHEYIAFHGALVGYRMANKVAMESWLSVYCDGLVGIYLPDTFSVEAYLKNVDYKMASLFRGLRQDSGSPFIFGEKINKMYEKFGIETETKSLIFSNGLSTHNEIDKITDYFKKTNKVSFGIGTWITNNIDGAEPLKIVIKMTSVKINNEWFPVIKISDDKGKYSGLIDEVNRAKITLGIQ